MKYILAILLIVSGLFYWQFDSMKQKAFYAMVNTVINHSVAEVRPSGFNISGKILLDAREKEEFKVSKIGDARFVGYDNFDLSSVKDLDKDAEIIVYCSIGYRSEKVAEKMEAAGFTSVKNLYGGIFDWYNSGKKVLDSLGNETNKIHGYSRTWGIWLNDAKTVY